MLKYLFTVSNSTRMAYPSQDKIYTTIKNYKGYEGKSSYKLFIYLIVINRILFMVNSLVTKLLSGMILFNEVLRTVPYLKDMS